MRALLSTQPADLPVGRAHPAGGAGLVASLAECAGHELARWRIIARRPPSGPAPPSSSAPQPGWSAEALPAQGGAALTSADSIVINAYLSAYTGGLLAWADCNGERKLEELVDEAFDALADL